MVLNVALAARARRVWAAWWGAMLLWAVAAVASAQSRGLPDFTDLVEQVGPSVVNIRTMERVAARGTAGGNPSEEEMLEFFRRFGLPVPSIPRQGPRQNRPQQPQPQEEEQPRGVGSGFILSTDGYIMTNAHVVEGADDMIVTLTDKREFKAKLIGADKRSDVAVVKIEASGLPAVKVGDVSRLKVGEWVMAIGSPFGLENTVTAGIVSAKQRDTGDYLPFIQTDVAINPGNSGGPLINMRGEVVGINSQIYSRSGGFMGISFSIPIDEAIRVSDQLRQHGRVTRGRIGVQIEQVTKELAESLGLAKPQGALVRAVESGSPADKAGVEPGDIIVRFDGKAIDKSSDLPRMVGGTKPGNKSSITVFRRGATKDLAITIAEMEAEKVAGKTSPAQGKPKATAATAALGLSVSELSESDKRELQVRSGVRVESATEAAARAGLREGDVILEVANTEIGSAKDLEQVLARADKSKSLPIKYRRGEWTQYAIVRASMR
ncbi:MAG: DegQ family serine endoprotease [Rhodoferax sp.]